MKTVTLKVETLQQTIDGFARVWTDGTAEPTSIAFATWDLMHRALSPKRLDILRAMCAQKPMSIRELARRVGRDFKGVHTDVTTLLNAGLIERTGSDIHFPYERIHVDFDIDAAA